MPSPRLNLGVLYQNGRGVAQDNAEAAPWFQKEADHANAEAQDNLRILRTRFTGAGPRR